MTGTRASEAKGWMKEAARVARGALCYKAKCGTVIVKDGEIIGEGFNAPPLDREENRMCDKERGPGKPGYDQTCCVHSEWRAIEDALRRNAGKIEGSKLYFTRVNKEGEMKRSGKPYCTECSRLALDAGVGHFLLWHEEGIGEYPTVEYNQLSYRYMPTSTEIKGRDVQKL